VARATDPDSPARSFADYAVTVDKTGVPAGVALIEKL